MKTFLIVLLISFILLDTFFMFCLIRAGSLYEKEQQRLEKIRELTNYKN